MPSTYTETVLQNEWEQDSQSDRRDVEEQTIHSAMHTETSDEVAGIAKRYTGRGVTQFDESGATLAENMGVTVSKMQDSVEAHHQTSLKNGRGSG